MMFFKRTFKKTYQNQRMMKLVRMTGGLGNQMFIYAFYIQMKTIFPELRIDMSEMKKYKLHNGYELEDVFSIRPQTIYAHKWLKRVIVYAFFSIIREKSEEELSIHKYTQHKRWPLVYYKGFFQSELFFKESSDTIRDIFSFNTENANFRTKEWAKIIKEQRSNVSIHIRRGDYTSAKNKIKYGNICTEEYYQKAISIILKKEPKAFFHIFSDDVEWTKAHLKIHHLPHQYISWNKGPDSWQDMMLMSLCRHNIIANSSFSWWGAWLNAYKDKTVIAPSRWSNVKKTPHILPESWISIDI